MPTVRGMEVPTLVLTPAHDQFSAPDATEAIISEWPQTTHETVASADHFLNGRTGLVAERAVAFITRTPCA
jgi:alpha/beta superfamily hydrolase